jgi:hypothetical protein
MTSDPEDPAEHGKRCRDCGEVKALGEFWARKASPDGKALYCKACFSRRTADAYRQRERARGKEPREYQPTTKEALPHGMKRCADCRGVLPLADFVRNQGSKDGAGSYCRPCQNKRVNESRQRVHGGSRHYHLKRRYGIGADEVDAMIKAQFGVCPICLTWLASTRAHVDHDHLTGEVRAVLCFNCNGGLGQFRDQPDALRRAAAYVEGEVWQPTLVAPGVFRLPS